MKKIIGSNRKVFWDLLNLKLVETFESVNDKTLANPNFYQWKFTVNQKHFSSDKGKTRLLNVGGGDGEFVMDTAEYVVHPSKLFNAIMTWSSQN